MLAPFLYISKASSTDLPVTKPVPKELNKSVKKSRSSGSC